MSQKVLAGLGIRVNKPVSVGGCFVFVLIKVGQSMLAKSWDVQELSVLF